MRTSFWVTFLSTNLIEKPIHTSIYRNAQTARNWLDRAACSLTSCRRRRRRCECPCARSLLRRRRSFSASPSFSFFSCLHQSALDSRASERNAGGRSVGGNRSKPFSFSQSVALQVKCGVVITEREAGVRTHIRITGELYLREWFTPGWLWRPNVRTRTERSKSYFVSFKFSVRARACE